MTNTADTTAATMARPAGRKGVLANDPKTGGTTFTPPTATPKSNLRAAAKKVNAAPAAAPAKKAAEAPAAPKQARTPSPDRLPGRDAFREAILTVLKAKSPQSMADIYAKVEKLLKLTDAQKAVTLASGEATWMRHVRSADRQLRQAELIVANDDRTRSAAK